MAWFSLKNHPYIQLATTIKGEMQKREREKDIQELWPKSLALWKGDVEKARDTLEYTVRNKPAWRALMGPFWIRACINDMTKEGDKKDSAARG
jgi:hypothetical protein